MDDKRRHEIESNRTPVEIKLNGKVYIMPRFRPKGSPSDARVLDVYKQCAISLTTYIPGIRSVSCSLFSCRSHDSCSRCSVNNREEIFTSEEVLREYDCSKPAGVAAVCVILNQFSKSILNGDEGFY